MVRNWPGGAPVLVLGEKVQFYRSRGLVKEWTYSYWIGQGSPEGEVFILRKTTVAHTTVQAGKCKMLRDKHI